MTSPALKPTIFYLHRLGDMVMLTALTQFLHRRYGAPCQIIGTGSWTPQLYSGSPHVSAVWSFGRHRPFLLSLGWLSLVRALNASDPGPIYVPEYHRPQLARVKRMLFCSGVNPARCLFTDDVPGGTDERWVEAMVRFGARTPPALDPGDYPPPSNTAAWTPQLYVLHSELRDCQDWIAAQGWQGRPLILVQPVNHRTLGWRRGRRRFDDKAWPLERWVELLRRLHASLPQALIVLRGAPGELSVLAGIQAAADIEAVKCAGLTLRQTYALCKLAHSMVSVDTGPAHAAAALGLPLVVLYGVAHQRVWLPRGAGGSPVIGIGGPPYSTRVEEISVDAVFEAWCRLAGQSPAPSATAARPASA